MIGTVKSRETGRDVSGMSGVIVVDKPAGKTSFDVIRDVRKSLGIRKIGHTGTLDPIATGVLPLCINEATKVASFLTDEDKEYRATMLLGLKTDTQDITGTVIETRDPGRVTREELQGVVESFRGPITQKVPRYSAAKYQGRPYHRWAREGVQLDPPEKEVVIHSIEIESFSLPYAILRVACSKGTYIRALCDDMGDILGCGAALADLRRTRSGSFAEEDALCLESVSREEAATIIQNRMVPLQDILGNLKAVSLPSGLARKIREGCQPEWGHLKESALPDFDREELVRLLVGSADLVALARARLSSEELASAGEREQVFKLVRVFNG